MRPLPVHVRTPDRYVDWGLQGRQDAGIDALLGLAQRTTLSNRADQPGYSRHNRHRKRAGSGRGWRGPLLAVILLAGLGVAWCQFRSGVLLSFMLGAAAFNMTVATLEVRWRLYAWRTPDAARQLAWPQPVEPTATCMSFSLIVPVRDEAAVISDTLLGLVQQDHPQLQVIVSLCDDDDATIAAASRVARNHSDRIRLVIGHYESSSKALQLNAALPFCTGDVVGVIDAEDDVATTLLRHVEALFLTSGSDVVQGGVQLMNLGDRLQKWFQVHNILEYFYWFTSRMAYQVDAGFVPLGGNTVFVYRKLLEEAGGWPVTLTEDCALGVVLATEFGATVSAAYSARLSTREESPPTIFNKKLGALFWQRDRWVRGFVSELVDCRWLKMPTLRGRILAGYILATPLLQAISGILLPFAIVTALLVKAPIGLTLLMFVPLIPLGVTVITQLIGLREFARTYQQHASVWHYASVLFLAPLYQIILMAAAAVAVYKHAKGDTTWYKTGRAAEHREPVAACPVKEGVPALQPSI